MPFVEIDFSDLEFYEALASGSSGSVFRALWKSAEKIVAVKKLLLLEKEAEVLSSLSHRNIVKFFGAVTVAPNFSIITEFAEYGSLYNYLKKRSIDFNQILIWAKEIALGMNYLHFEAPIPVIHRDLKSKNVVITGDLVAKLCDFGSSKFHPHTTKLTLVGTFPWMAPEVIQGLPVTTSCDVFSYSVVLWELLTHEVPFHGLEGLQVAWLVVAKEERLTIPSSCPPMFADLMTKCWASDPAERLSFKEILEVLENMLRSDSLERETETFLGQKNKWKGEIDSKLEQLKTMERTLHSKEEQLRKRERELAVREKQLTDTLTRNTTTTPEHDVNVWDPEEVADWVFHLGNGSDVCGYAELFAKNHVSGKRLFMLTDNDLLQIGVLSVGHRKELMDEIEHLRQDNHRLMHFPPISITSFKSPARPKPPEPTSEALTIVYSNLCRQRAPPENHLWKYLIDFDGNSAGASLVKEVHIVFAKFVPVEVVALTKRPFVSEGWRQEPDPQQVVVVVYYKDKVEAPRETRYTFVPSETCHTEELCVRVQIKPKCPKISLSDSVASESPITMSMGDSYAATLSLTSSQLSGVWAARAEFLRPPLEPRSTNDNSYTSDYTDSVSSATGSIVSNDGEATKRRPALQGAWSGSSGAQIVKTGAAKNWSSATPIRRSPEPVPRTFNTRSQSQPAMAGQQVRHHTSDQGSYHQTQNYGSRQRRDHQGQPHNQARARSPNYQVQAYRARSPGYQGQSTNYQGQPRSYDHQRRGRSPTYQGNPHGGQGHPQGAPPNYRGQPQYRRYDSNRRIKDSLPEEGDVGYQRSVSDIGPQKQTEGSPHQATRETVPQGRGRGRHRGK